MQLNDLNIDGIFKIRELGFAHRIVEEWPEPTHQKERRVAR
jgi:hypothetical protein